MNKQEFCCADCGIFFDKDVSSGQTEIFCPKCGRDVMKKDKSTRVCKCIMDEIKPYSDKVTYHRHKDVIYIKYVD